MKPLVSIICFAYNHENYINKALESFFMQKTDFHYEIIIHDDASPDNTQNIIKKHEKKYPGILKPIYQKENQKSKGNGIVTRTAFSAAQGKYIALCEGDDYWIDPLKLQKQVNFLESNPDFSLCFHNAIVLWNDKSQPPQFFCSKDQKEISSIENIIEKWLIPSASMVFRNEYITPLPIWFKNIYNGDYALQLVLANKGNFGYINEVMSIYRKSPGNMSSTVDPIYVQNSLIQTLSQFNKHTNFKYENLINVEIEKLKKAINKTRFWIPNLLVKYVKLKYLNKILNKKGYHLVRFR